MKKFLTILLVLVAMVAQAQTLNYKGKFTLNVELDGAEKQFASYNIYLSDKYFHTPKQATTSVPVKDGKFTYEVEVDYMKGLCLKGVDAQGKEQAGPGVEVYAVPNVTYDVKIAGGQLTPTKSQSDQYPWLSKVERYSWDARRATKWTSPYLPKPAGTRWSEVEQRCDTFYRMSVKEVWLGKKETVVRLMSEACDARRGAGKDDYLLDENGKQYKMVRTLLGNPGEDNSAEVGVYGGYYAFEPLPQTVKSFTYVSGTCKVSEVRKAGKKPVKEPAPNFKVTIHPTNGIFDTGYLLYMYDRLEKPNNQLGILKDVPCDENREVYFETYIDEPTEFYMLATFADGSICPTGVKIPAFPGHAIVNVMDGTYELTGDEGFYKEMQDAIDFVENTWGSDKDSGEKNKQIRRYLLNHANEQGTLYAYYYRYLLSIDQMYDVLNDKQLDTPIGRLIMERYKAYEEQVKKAKEIARNSSQSTSSYQRRRADNYKPDLDLLRSQAPAGNSVDLGLSVMWADMNVGAKTSSEAGQAYNWGDVEVPPFRNQSWLYYKWCKGSNKDLTKYCTLSEYGQTDNLSTLLPEDDAAAALWQGEWRIPTKEEWDELVTKCTWTETIESGVKGYKVTGPNGHSIFLPYTGCLNWQGVYGKGEHAYYWSSSIDPKNPSFAYYMHADTNKQEVGAMDRFAGRFIRPVRTAIQANKKEKVGKTVKGAVEYTVNGVKFNMIKVEGGTFEMGSKPKNIHEKDVMVSFPNGDNDNATFWTKTMCLYKEFAQKGVAM